MRKNSLRAFAALSLSLVLGLARAQDSDPYDDPPDRAARLSYLSGDVSMQPAGEEEWAPAILNRPLTTGDKLWTERAARAEIQVGAATVRLGDDTGFSFLNVDDDTIQMRMTAGVVYVNVRALEGNDHIEIDTPNVALSVLRPGNYRVEVDDAGDSTTVKISEGEVEADGPGQNVVVHAQQVATFRGNDQLVADWGSLGSPDDFDRWNLERDRRDERLAARTSEYVSPDVTGYEDLDENGTWSSEPEYGYVWTPRHVVTDWSPYRYGRWVWISPWGWTWIDDAPWGYAPFHYGRWAHVRNRWCWVPGPRHVRAVYAPALVGWVGSPGLNVSISVGSGVGWFPLGPREVWVPGRHFSRRYVERANVSNTVIVNRTYINEVYVNGGRHVDYRNRHVPGGFTAVSRDTFVTAGRTGDRRARMDEREFARADVSNTPHLLPGRESRLGGAPRTNVRVPPRAVVDRQVIVKRDPPPAGARFTRGRPNNGEDLARAPSERFQRPPDRQQDRDSRGDGNRNDAVVERNRPVGNSPQPRPQPDVQQSTPEPRAFEDHHRDDRPPKQRDGRGDDRSYERQQRAWQDSREQQQREVQERDSRELQQRQMQERDSRQQQVRQMQERDSREQQVRQMQERNAREQQQDRDRFQRQQDSERQRNEARQQQDRQQQDRQQQERQQQDRQQQDRQRSEERQRPRNEPKQDDKPRRPRNDDDSPRAQRQ
jgi:flagellar biosynthesis GTPase FlhF